MNSRKLAILTLSCAMMLSACASGALTARAKGALGGGALGGGAGAIIGHQTGHAGAGAAIGGALGALGGVVVGDSIEAQNQRSNVQDAELESQRREIENLKRQQRQQDDYYERY